MADIFLSYTRTDSERARELAEALGREGWSVFWDVKLRAGTEWPTELERELAAATAVVVLWSAASASSRWVLEEATRAEQDGKLVPVRLDDSDLRLGFTQLHTIDLSTWSLGTTHAGYSGLVEDLRSMLAPTTKPAAIIVDASHGQRSWTWAGRYLPAARRLAGTDGIVVDSALDRRLDDFTPEGSVLVVANPFEAIVSNDAADRIMGWVEEGGGLLVMGHYLASVHHGGNPNLVANQLGLDFADDILLPLADRSSEQLFNDCRAQAADLAAEYQVQLNLPSSDKHEVLAGVGRAALQSACSIDASRPPDFALSTEFCTVAEIARARKDDDGFSRMIHEYRVKPNGQKQVVALWDRTGRRGRIAAVGTWRLVILEEGDTPTLASNLIDWLRS